MSRQPTWDDVARCPDGTFLSRDEAKSSYAEACGCGSPSQSSSCGNAGLVGVAATLGTYVVIEGIDYARKAVDVYLVQKKWNDTQWDDRTTDWKMWFDKEKMGKFREETETLKRYRDELESLKGEIQGLTREPFRVNWNAWSNIDITKKEITRAREFLEETKTRKALEERKKARQTGRYRYSLRGMFDELPAPAFR